MNVFALTKENIRQKILGYSASVTTTACNFYGLTEA